MNIDIDNKIKNFKEIQSKLLVVLDNIEKEDKSKINEVWKDKNSELFLEELDGVCSNVTELIARIDETIKELARVSNNGGTL